MNMNIDDVRKLRFVIHSTKPRASSNACKKGKRDFGEENNSGVFPFLYNIEILL